MDTRKHINTQNGGCDANTDHTSARLRDTEALVLAMDARRAFGPGCALPAAHSCVPAGRSSQEGHWIDRYQTAKAALGATGTTAPEIVCTAQPPPGGCAVSMTDCAKTHNVEKDAPWAVPEVTVARQGPD